MPEAGCDCGKAFPSSGVQNGYSTTLKKNTQKNNFCSLHVLQDSSCFVLNIVHIDSADYKLMKEHVFLFLSGWRLSLNHAGSRCAFLDLPTQESSR